MSTGYVLDFTNRTFQQFVLETTGKDIYDDQYSSEGVSKANRLRAFWKLESNYVIAQLNLALLEHWEQVLIPGRGQPVTSEEQDLLEKCRKILTRLQETTFDDHIQTILRDDPADRDITRLARTIRDTIEKDEPEVGLDRLHTYATKLIRQFCDKHGIAYDKKKPLHSCFGEYVKYLRQSGLVESEMTYMLLKMSISALDSFSEVRNNRSLAHDNRLLGYGESLLIFKWVFGLLVFIGTIEASADRILKKKTVGDEDLPF